MGSFVTLEEPKDDRHILAANWWLNTPPQANNMPRIDFLPHIIAPLESPQDTSFLGQLKALLTGPELPVASEVVAAKSKLANFRWFGMVLQCLPEQLSAQAVAEKHSTSLTLSVKVRPTEVGALPPALRGER